MLFYIPARYQLVLIADHIVLPDLDVSGCIFYSKINVELINLPIHLITYLYNYDPL